MRGSLQENISKGRDFLWVALAATAAQAQAHWPKAINSGGLGAGPQGTTGEPGGWRGGLPVPGRDSPGRIHGGDHGLLRLGRAIFEANRLQGCAARTERNTAGSAAVQSLRRIPALGRNSDCSHATQTSASISESGDTRRCPK
jgi:hypothetical protein